MSATSAERVQRNRSHVEILSRREAKRAVDRTLASTGLTYEELRDQARAGRFSSERARLTWAAVRDR